MTFDAQETSLAAGRPVRLYEFHRGLTSWRFAAADRDVMVGMHEYLGTAIMDDGLRQTGESSAEELVITAPHDLPVARLYRGVVPSDEIGVTLRDWHFGDDEAVVAWTGHIIGVRWPSEERAQIRCESLTASIGRAGIRLTWERGCPHALYDDGCGVERELFRVPATLDTVAGGAVESSTFLGFADGWFAGGYLEWSIGDSLFERRTIGEHTGAALSIVGGTHGLVAGMSVSAFPGCARIIEVCEDKFDNRENYGGIPHLPGKSPFDGDPVF